jgi:2-alkenal reductase
LRDGGEAEYAYIGVSSQPLYPQLARKLGLDTDFGSLVSEVAAGGPAAEAGIKGGDEKLTFQAGRYRVGGDVILDIDGEKIVRPDDLAEVVADRQPGDTVTVTVLRDGQRKDIQLTLGKRPDDASG